MQQRIHVTINWDLVPSGVTTGGKIIVSDDKNSFCYLDYDNKNLYI